MAEKDITERLLTSHNDVFADIVNGCFTLLGGGRPFRRVEPEDLRDTRARSAYKAFGELHEQERDVAKLWTAGGAVICLLGLENQTAVDPNMPLRVFGYEGGDYRWQLTQKGLKPYPVLTLVLYFGTERRWPSERTLFARLNVDEALRPFLNDCRVNVLEVAWLTEEEASVFTSDFRIVVDYFCQIRQDGKYEPSAWEIAHVDAMFKFMAGATGNRRFETAQERFKNREGVTMMDVFQDVENRGRMEGIALGRAEGITLGRAEGIAFGRAEGRDQLLFSLVNDGLLSADVAAARANMSEEEFRARMERDRQAGGEAARS